MITPDDLHHDRYVEATRSLDVGHRQRRFIQVHVIRLHALQPDKHFDSTFRIWSSLIARLAADQFSLGQSPWLTAVAGALLLGTRDYSRAYFSRGPGDRNRGDGRSRILRKRPLGRGDPASSQTPHETFCLSRATCSGKPSAKSTTRRSRRN